jgi:cytidine deaminase
MLSPSALTDADLLLLEEATTLVGARSDGETHIVAAAARTTDGVVVTGLNLFHFNGGPCAELVAIANAAAHTAAPPSSIVAVGDRGRGVLAPCGRCRQVLLDLHPTARVQVPGPAGPTAATVPELLPRSYRWQCGQ